MARFVTRVPLWFRQAILDFVVGGAVAIIGLNLTIPGSLDQARAQALVIAVAVLKALAGVAEGVIRSHSADIIGWLKGLLQVPASN